MPNLNILESVVLLFRRCFAWVQAYHRPIGLLIGLAGVVFVVVSVRQDLSEIPLSEEFDRQLLLLAKVSSIFWVLNFGLGLSWWTILHTRRQPAPLAWAVASFGIAQIGKYVPGNIFHLASRQIISVGLGLDGKAVGLSQIMEIGILAIVAASYGCFLLPIWVGEIETTYIFILFILCQVTFMLALIVMGWAWCILSAAVYHLFFVLSGGCLLLFLNWQPMAASEWSIVPPTVAAFAISWIVGLLTPGSPAGIGVRESVLIFALSATGISEGVSLATIMLRLSTVIADVAFFLFALLLIRRFENKSRSL